MANMTWVYKQGAVGKVLTGTLQAGGAGIDLSNKTVTMSARRIPSAEPVLDNVEITLVSPETGGISWTVDAAAAEVRKSSEEGYLMEFKLDEGGTIDYIPTDKNGARTYGRLIVQENLD